MPWFESKLVASNGIIIKKQVGVGDGVRTVSNLDFAPQHTSLPQFDHIPISCQNADTERHKNVAYSDVSIDQASKSHNGQMTNSVDSDLLPPKMSLPMQDVPTQEHQSWTPVPVLEEDKAKQEITSISTGTPSSDCGEGPFGNVARQHIVKSTAEPVVDSHLAPALPMMQSAHKDPSSNDDHSSTERVSEITCLIPANRQYTMRQLARIALVAANGFRMTTSQVIVWLAQNFTHLRVGEGSWERSVRSALSGFDEFHGEKIVGTRGNKKLYGFASVDVKARYDREYSEYCNTTDTITQHFEPRQGNPELGISPSKAAPTRERHEPQNRKVAKKSAPSLHTTISMSYRSELNVPTNLARLSKPLDEQENNKDSALGPFARPKPRQPLKMLDHDLGIMREANFHDTFAPNPQLDIETMTGAEKTRKIAEIKGRPSRKKYFGSDHRLAHKRRYSLEDIHDERDGAWKPHQSAKDCNRTEPQDYVSMDGEEIRTLRQIFDLPDNIIPMNDGQTELAFRDRTLVSICADEDATRQH